MTDAAILRGGHVASACDGRDDEANTLKSRHFHAGTGIAMVVVSPDRRFGTLTNGETQ
jgi:hypothetical protein